VLWNIDNGDPTPAPDRIRREVWTDIDRLIPRKHQDAMKTWLGEQVELRPEILCTSWITGPDWRDTPLQILYEVTGDEELAARWYGLFMWPPRRSPHSRHDLLPHHPLTLRPECRRPCSPPSPSRAVSKCPRRTRRFARPLHLGRHFSVAAIGGLSFSTAAVRAAGSLRNAWL
jgi:hypothetical protein